MIYYITHTGKLMCGDPPAGTRHVGVDPREVLLSALSEAAAQQGIISNRQRNLDRKVVNIKRELSKHVVRI